MPTNIRDLLLILYATVVLPLCIYGLVTLNVSLSSVVFFIVNDGLFLLYGYYRGYNWGKKVGD